MIDYVEEEIVRHEWTGNVDNISRGPLLVRCKDCKYGEPCGVLIGCGTTKGFGITHEPDWFCADGERRTEDA